MRKTVKSDRFSYFIRYFIFFTVVFAVMTAIILNSLRRNVYHSVDKNLTTLMEQQQYVLKLVKQRWNRTVNEEETPQWNQVYTDEFDISRLSKPDELIANDTSHEALNNEILRRKLLDPKFGDLFNMSYTIVLINKDGKVYNELEKVSKDVMTFFDQDHLETIQQANLSNNVGNKDSFRLISFKINNISDIRGFENRIPTLRESEYKKLPAYAMILVNTNQLDNSVERITNIVLVTMFIFWGVSTVVSAWLAKISIKPIRESYERQKEFVSNASHELRTPLAVLQNRLESLFRKPNATILESSEAIGASLDEVRNMRRLIQNLLDLSRRDSGLQVKNEWIEPGFFDDLFQNFALLAEDSGKELTVENHLTKPFKSDPSLLQQVLTILVDNAMKYTGEDGQIEVSVKSMDRSIVLCVADNGEGIPQDQKKKIFDRFYRVNKSRTRQTGGFGLGLSLAKQIVEVLKGTIKVKDRQPKGSIFEVKLHK